MSRPISPTWSNPARPGLQSAVENIATDEVVFTVTPATPQNGLYYNVYMAAAGTQITSSSLFWMTRDPVFALDTSALPIEPGMVFDVRAAVGAVSIETIPFTAGTENNLWSYPVPLQLGFSISQSDTELTAMSSWEAYPSDGYLLVGNEVVYYSSVSAPFPSFPSLAQFAGLIRGAYGSTASAWPGTTPIELYRGAEAPGRSVGLTLSCGLRRPSWANPNDIGLSQARDRGDGYTVDLSWDRAIVPGGFSQVQYLVYRSAYKKDLYSIPRYITSAQSIVISDVRPTAGQYFATRAAYFFPNFTTSGMLAAADGYVWPAPTEISVDLTIGSIGTLAAVTTQGYPETGLLKIGHEVVSYSSKTPDSFNVSRRDVFGIRWSEDYPSGTPIELFRGIDDGECFFWLLNTSHDGYGVAPLPLEAGDGYWGFQYLQDPDGYRNHADAPLDEDHSNVVDDAEAADPFDYCGLRANDQSQLLSGDYCAPASPTEGGGGTYHGNSALGEAGGIDVFEGNLERQEILLGITGSPFVLLRRRTTGRTCSQLSHRNEHPFARCSECYGTGFVGGYDRYIHTRRLRPAEENPNGFIAVRVDPYSDDVVLTDDHGLSTERTELSCWLPAVPTIRVRDILIRYNFDYETKTYEEEFRYEVLTVNRNQIVLGKDGAQKLTIRRLNPTEESYKYPVFTT